MGAAVTCGSCGTGLREGARFCDRCGSPTEAVGESAEYKQVTVLFADVVRSMRIAAAVEPERFREIMAGLVERAAVAVARYGGRVDYTGDGVMAIFGAPEALEDHATRACLAALAIQREAKNWAVQVARRDAIDLRVRVGLNSGQVIAGELGFGSSFGYTAVGEQVGFAQRMESVAPPGGVMVSESTARLVHDVAELAAPQWVRVKGSDRLVRARRLLAIVPRHAITGRTGARLIGRRRELASFVTLVDRAIGGGGSVVNVVAPPGIGKSRIAQEVATSARTRGADVLWTFCESHTRDVPFHTVAGLLRTGLGVVGLDAQAARARVRHRLVDADAEDLLLLDDLLGIADSDVLVPAIDPDARRRRLIALINAASQARAGPAVLIIEDVHWIDSVSESLLVGILSVLPQTPTVVLITSRPEYQGALSRLPDAQHMTLSPLDASETAMLVGELLGADPSVGELAEVIVDRAAGNPFFAEEMVRELVQRGILVGEQGNHRCPVDVADVSVPVTVQATIEARIDALPPPAKRTVHMAAVIGARIPADLLGEVENQAAVDDLLHAELIDQVRAAPNMEYVFRHPLIRAVAYESQLRADRADRHRRVATAMCNRGADDENAALIAGHFEAAGDMNAAYRWHMRSGGWSASRDLGTARVSWERACRVADGLPGSGPDVLDMRIAPRSMLCATDWQAWPVQDTWGRFADLRELCTAAGDKVSLAIGMSGLAAELLYVGRPGEGSTSASDQMALLESVGDPGLTVGLSFLAFANWFNAGEFGQIRRWAQTVIDLADGDPTMGSGFGLGSPLAMAMAFRGIAGWWRGGDGWQQDLDEALVLARASDPGTHALVVTWIFGPALFYGVVRADDATMRAIEAAEGPANAAVSDFGLLGARYMRAIALLYRDAADERDQGLALMAAAAEFLRDRAPSLLPLIEVLTAREQAGRGDLDGAIPAMRTAIAVLRSEGRPGWGIAGVAVLVETLLARGAEGDVGEARAAIDWVAETIADSEPAAIPGLTLLRLRALLARAVGDVEAHRDLARRYLSAARAFDFDGHVHWARAMLG
ncbi:adenylate/guanylate cyclase domain-containing protein [Gordonia sp. Z-3]|uniref:adenylate/guanylate cyclase domain-containing protein n=1 Tax=Gordonia sp. Z-3 TaxID=3115408 RepID=UPI002E29B131|nr:adenylate/guanylate cyclase domain-containing protein [Gordonia sp. Z-3]MED5801937.1 adenylate/guanylate cyclase domain-containing protein [Gordonia sp. Z-3]